MRPILSQMPKVTVSIPDFKAYKEETKKYLNTSGDALHPIIKNVRDPGLRRQPAAEHGGAGGSQRAALC